MLLGIADGHSKPQRLPSWRACSICQWLDEDLKATRPHIKLVTQTGAIAKEDELLHGELGPIANAILCRLEQPEFNNTSLFPVSIFRYIMIISADHIYIYRCSLSRSLRQGMVVSYRPNSTILAP